MTDALQIRLWGHTVGYLSWDNLQHRAVFKYDDSFLELGWNISPLDVYSATNPACHLPQYGHTDALYQGLPPFIADSLPDKWGNQVFAHWAELHHVTKHQLSPLDRLAFIGSRGMGALEFVPASMPSDETMQVNAEELYHIAQLIADERQQMSILNHEHLLVDDLYRVGTSAGGRRPKAIIAIHQDGTQIRSGQVMLPKEYTYYILKFHESQTDFPITLVEMAYYDMACAAGITMMPSRLWTIGGVPHFLTERFDRLNGQKQYMLTLAGINSLATSYDDLFATCRRLHLPHTQVQQLYRRMVFNVLACNVDDHTKNFSFLMDTQGQWSLAPAYDMTFSWDLDAPRYVNRHCMTIMGKNDHITQTDLLLFAENNDIHGAEKVYHEVADVIERWPEFARIRAIDQRWIDRIRGCYEGSGLRPKG